MNAAKNGFKKMPLNKPEKKKLIQSRLPFSPIDPKSQKKRKLSNGSENQSSKALRTETVLPKEECTSPKHPTNTENIEDSNQDTVIEEKENLKCKSTEKIKNDVETPMEESNDGIEVLEIIIKSDSPKAASTSLKTASGISSVTKQANKKIEPVNKAKRKRESTSTASSNIKKFFRDDGERRKSPRKLTKTDKSETEKQTKELSGKSEKKKQAKELSVKSEKNKQAKKSSGKLEKEVQAKESLGKPEKEEQAEELSKKSEKEEQAEKSSGKPEKEEQAKEVSRKSEKEEQTEESLGKSEKNKQAKKSLGKLEKEEEAKESLGKLEKEEQAEELSEKSEKEEQAEKSSGKPEKEEQGKESSKKSEKEEQAEESLGKPEKEELAKESSGKPEISETNGKSKREQQAKGLSEKSEKSETKGKSEKEELAKESAGKSEESGAKGKSNIEEHPEDRLDAFNQGNKESELNESSESNYTAVTSDSGTPSSSGEGKTKEDKVVSAQKKTLVKSSLVKKRLTSKQKLLEEMKKKKQEERLKFKLQKDQEKKEKEQEKQRLKEERQQKKIEEQEMKEKEKEEKRQKREEERQKKEEKKEEERLKKEEKQKKEEEKLLAEEEERQKQKKLKAIFAQFFVAKKVESPSQQKEIENLSSNDNFVHFQVKENMRIAPVVRRSLSQKEKDKLENVLQTPLKEINYLQEIKKGSYVKGKSCKTFPPVDKLEEDDICEIISDEEDIDGTDVLETKSCPTKRLKAKFLKFCENNRPAYYGTWSKKSQYINGRKPFRREEIFDYDYDSDEDWEDIENGESLSDSDGEADDGGKEDSNQYEVDNEFFVPHGYLSDGEGEEDQENEEETEVENKEKDETFQKERLKQKQEEFEMEMKQKTKQLKPKVYGCVWMGDRTSHQAYDQLLKILMPYKAMVLFGTCPIGLGGKEMNNQELKENDDEEGQEDDSGKKFLKSFPEKAVPDLIRLIHGNRHSKLFLRREFSEYWKKKREEETETDSGSIAMRKIEPKIQEISQYGRFSENGVSLKYRTWYVSKEIREKYGLEDLSLKNSWQYTLPVKEWKHESKEDKQKNPDESEEPAASKPQTKSPFIGTNLITKFTKVLNGEEEKKRLFNVTSNNIIQSPSSSDVSASPDNSGAINILPATPSSGKKNRNNSIVTMFKNIKKEKTVGEKISSPADKDEQLECITIE